jgi:6-phosphogluconolactonase
MRTISLPPTEIRVFADRAILNRAAADEFIRVARAALEARGRFTVALAGGSTPKPIQALLAEDQRSGANQLPWEAIQVFFSDERHVPADHPDSNSRMAAETLLAHVPIPPENVHRVATELDPAAAAADYERQLRSVFSPKPGELPQFDLIMLGLGADGHTASLFPGSAALAERTAWVSANRAEKLQSDRITFTFPLLNAAAEVLFVATGGDKAEMLRFVLKGDPSGQTYPAQGVQPVSRKVLWMVDEEAARLL